MLFGSLYRRRARCSGLELITAIQFLGSGRKLLSTTMSVVTGEDLDFKSLQQQQCNNGAQRDKRGKLQ